MKMSLYVCNELLIPVVQISFLLNLEKNNNTVFMSASAPVSSQFTYYQSVCTGELMTKK